MEKRSLGRLLVTLVLAVFALAARAEPCVGFVDVDSSASYCSGVEWLKNRAITSGCEDSLFCPEQSLTRAQLAIMMNRLARSVGTLRLAVSQASGALSLPSDIPVRICESAPVAPADHPRTITMRLAVSAQAHALGMAWRASPMFSTTGGSNWVWINTASAHVSAEPWTWTNGVAIAVTQLPAGWPFRAAIGVHRDDVVTGTTGDFAGSYCELVVEIDNLNGLTTPLDERRREAAP